jgi:hypothetical protein
MNFTVPALLAVATIDAGSRPRTEFPPEITSVEFAAADAGELPMNTPLTSTTALIAIIDLTLFILILL